ncbi:hypothetical protein HK104_011098 [Borealophlyctis nickersoniae]|nr:hypothetical protein HK104_011098 [Borealophlyctis nickersoniae]
MSSSPLTTRPPVAAKVLHKHRYHGKEFEDHYHWMKDQNPEQKRPEIINYLNAENAYTKASHLDPNAGLIDTIYKEFVSRLQEDDDEAPVYKHPYFYYKRTQKGKQYPIYARKKGSMDAPEEVILDQNTFDYEYQGLGAYNVSPDHKSSQILAYGLDTSGDERYKVMFKNLESGALLESDTIPEATEQVEWCNDSRTVYYTMMDHIHRPHKVFRRTLGTPPESAQMIYHEPDEKFEVNISKTNSEKYVLVNVSSSLTREVHLLDADRPDADIRVFQPRKQNYTYYVEHQEDRFLVLADYGRRLLNFTLCWCPLDATVEENWKKIIPYDASIELTGVLPFADHFVLYERSEGLERMRVFPNNSPENAYYLDFPEDIYSVGGAGTASQNYHSSTIRFNYTSMLTPWATWEYDISTKERKLLKQKQIPNYDSSLYTMRRIYTPVPAETAAEAPFGTPVPDRLPISLVYRTDRFKGDGSNPCLLYGYGSYGISIDPVYNSKIFSYADRGFVYAIAHIRGGGELGRGWYETGKFKHKRNTFTDFIAAADHLVAEKYTSPDIMAMEGASAGGLLMGSVLNLRPDLVNVAIAGVPFVDVINTMMDPTIPLTVNEYEEWGNPNEKDYFDYMLSYSPYDNLEKGARFPNLLVKAGLNDPRVQYWEPAKWVAKMRDFKVDGGEGDPDRRTIVLDCKMGQGHSGPTGRYAYLKNSADDYAFVVSCIEKAQKRRNGAQGGKL